MVRKAMIMAAGVGSRLEPLTQIVPKPLIPIANKPVMEILLRKLTKYGINNVISNTYCLANQIHEKYENNDFGLNFQYIQEKTLSGTAGGVKKCEQFFDGEKTFLVMSADGLTGAKLDEIISSHKASGAIATMGVKEVPIQEVSSFGVVITDKNHRVTEFQEKPQTHEAKSNLVNTGIYVFETRIFDYIPADTFYDFAKNVFPALMENNEIINTYTIREYWSDIGTINQYKQSSTDILNELVDVDITAQKLKCGWVEKSAKIASSVNFKGSVLIGENTIIEENVTFKGNNTIGNNCVIKSGSIIADSILWDNVTIEDNVNLNDCIVSSDTVVSKNDEFNILTNTNCCLEI